MSNRFNAYRNVDYVNMPIDAYQFAAGANEQENLTRLNQSKQALDAFNNIQAVARPDQEVKQEIIDKINDDIKGLADKNLKGTDVLLNIGKIVNNPYYIDTLAKVQGNALDYQGFQKAKKTYSETYGNDVNSVRGDDIFSNYNNQGKDAFRSGVFQGIDPGKYVAVEDEVRKAMQLAKDSGYKQDYVSGNWVRSKGEKGLALPDLLKMVNPVLNDPTYAKQLDHYKYYEMRKWGDPSNPGEAVGNYNRLHAQDLDDKISQANTHLTEILNEQKKLPKDKRHMLDKHIEDTKAVIDQFTGQRDAYLTDRSGRMMSNDVVQNIGLGAVSPLVRMEREELIKEHNPFALSAQNSAQSLHNATLLENLRQRNKKDLFDYKEQYKDAKSKDEFINGVNPTVISKQIPTGEGNVLQQVPTFSLDKLGGYDASATADMVSNIVNGIPSIKDDISGKSVDWKSGLKTEYLAKGIREGRFQVSYVPNTKQLMISGDGVQVRVPAPMNMQARMQPVSDLYNPKVDESGVATVHGISLDGKTASTVYVVPDKVTTAEGDNTTTRNLQYMYTPSLRQIKTAQGVYNVPVDPVKITEENDKYFKEFSKTASATVGDGEGQVIGDRKSKTGPSMYAVANKPDGVYVLVKGAYKQEKNNVTYYTESTNAFKPGEFEKEKEKGFIADGAVPIYLRKKGNTIQLLNQIEGSEGLQNVLTSHMKYESLKGGAWHNARNTKLDKKAKVGTEEKDDEIDNEEE